MTYGDIKLGICDETELSYIYNFVKLKCQKGFKIFLKKNDDNEYYISAPIFFEDVNIYTDTRLGNDNLFYFDDLYAYDDITCITFLDKYISNKPTEGCKVNIYEKFDPTIYHILPVDQNFRINLFNLIN